MPLLLLFIAVPLIEIALFIQLGSLLGLWWTLLIVILTAIIGTYLVRQQGRDVLAQISQSFNTLQDPSEPLVHGAMILFSGALLLTPGFFTDAVGFALLVPGIRNWAFQRLRSRITAQSAQFHSHPSASPQAPPHNTVIDGDYHEVDKDQADKPQGPSGWTRH